MKELDKQVESLGMAIRLSIKQRHEHGILVTTNSLLRAISILEDIEKEYNLANKESVACHEYLNYKLKGSN